MLIKMAKFIFRYQERRTQIYINPSRSVRRLMLDHYLNLIHWYPFEHRHGSSQHWPLELTPFTCKQHHYNQLINHLGLMRIETYSIPMTFPLTHSPSAEARKATTRATSSGWPTRLCGDQVAAYSSTWSLDIFSPPGMYSLQTAWYMSVLIPPGATQFTVIFLSPQS